MKVFVTGGAGYLGRRVCERLREEGHEVTILDQHFDGELPGRLEVVDLLDYTAAYRLLRDADALVHLANHPNERGGFPRPRLYGENVVMTGNVLFAAAELGVKRIVFASSIQAVSGRRSSGDETQPSCLAYLPLDADTPQCPGNSYALGKCAGEDLLRFLAQTNEGLSCLAVRFPMLLDRRYLGYYRRVHRLDPYWGSLDEGFTYLTTDDAGRLVAAALARSAPGYRQCLPAAPDNVLRSPAAEVARTYCAGVPIRVPAERFVSLVETGYLREWFGWQPQDVDVFGPPGGGPGRAG